MTQHVRCMLFAACSLAIATASLAGDETSKGKQVFDAWCTACHAPGMTHPGTLALHFRYRGQVPEALEAREDMTAAFIEHVVRAGIGGMPPFRKTEISDAQLNALMVYLAKAK